MRSHSYQVSIRTLFRILGAPLFGSVMIAAILHGARWTGLMPHARPIDNPDETLLIFKARVSTSRHPAEVVLLGDSSCATGVEAPELSALLPEHPRVLNLGLMVGLGLDVYGEALTEYANHNPGALRIAVLLVTPQLLTNEGLAPNARQSWHQAHVASDAATLSGHSRLAQLFGVPLLKECVFRQVLNTPARIGNFYAFTSDFADYLNAHDGSMIDPSTFRPPVRPILNHYYLAPAIEQPSREFRRRLPSGVKLAVTVMPIPESLAPADYVHQRRELLLAWNRSLQADYVLTNAPAKLGDTFFATGAHLNRIGQMRYTRQLATILSQLHAE